MRGTDAVIEAANSIAAKNGVFAPFTFNPHPLWLRTEPHETDTRHVYNVPPASYNLAAQRALTLNLWGRQWPQELQTIMLT
eukprot:1887057-Pyramimonas_sp.AAC.1